MTFCTGDRLLRGRGLAHRPCHPRTPGADRVDNMTVEGEHVYYVSTLGACYAQ